MHNRQVMLCTIIGNASHLQLQKVGGVLKRSKAFEFILFTCCCFNSNSNNPQHAHINNSVPGDVFPVGVPLFERWTAVDRLTLAQIHELIHTALHLLASVPDPQVTVPTGALPVGYVSVLQRGWKHEGESSRWWVRRWSIIYSILFTFCSYSSYSDDFVNLHRHLKSQRKLITATWNNLVDLDQ